ncbi:hypothetical protein [Ottowia sp.]|uniref:hypothetical protein n=1 Tax=Ottowia sp. TaxID=1898956 RepID=UPI0039E24FF0
MHDLVRNEKYVGKTGVGYAPHGVWCTAALAPAEGFGLLALLPLLSAITTDRPLWRSLAEGDWVFAGFELTLWALAALHAALAIRTARHQPKARPVRKAPAKAEPQPGLRGANS